jgi:mono/diheme cytochrome c family protein
MKAERKILAIRGVEEEPSVNAGHMPVIFVIILAGLLFGSFLYLDEAAGGFNNQVYAPYSSYARVAAAQPQDPGARKRARGKVVYDTTCMLCHQATGLGNAGQAPALDGSEWVNGPVSRLARIPMHGLTGPITVNGQPWNASMAAMGAGLNAEDMAALLTYIRSAWSNKSSEVMEDQVKKVMEATAGRAEQWTADELLKIAEGE